MRNFLLRVLCVAVLSAGSYTIVVPKEADVSTRAVAEDFAGILKEITGATFPIVSDDSDVAAREIVIGEKNARLHGLNLFTSLSPAPLHAGRSTGCTGFFRPIWAAGGLRPAA